MVRRWTMLTQLSTSATPLKVVKASNSRQQKTCPHSIEHPTQFSELLRNQMSLFSSICFMQIAYQFLHMQVQSRSTHQDRCRNATLRSMMRYDSSLGITDGKAWEICVIPWDTNRLLNCSMLQNGNLTRRCCHIGILWSDILLSIF